MTKFIYSGKYNGDENSLPQREHPEGAVMFKEAEDMKKLSLVMNIAAILIFLILVAIIAFITRHTMGLVDLLAFVVSYLLAVPHEFLHALVMKGNVYMYQNLAQGMLFVVSTEAISKWRFVFMSLLPNLVFGVVPFVVFLLFPNLSFLGYLGAMCIAMGAGDYYNVFNAITQMPKGSLTYLCGMHSYWYMPTES